MTVPAFTARNVSKFVVKAFVAHRTARLTAETIDNHTDYDKDSFLVDNGTLVLGWYVSEKLEPVTDKIVDKTADFVTAQRAKRQAKKNAQQQED